MHMILYLLSYSGRTGCFPGDRWFLNLTCWMQAGGVASGPGWRGYREALGHLYSSCLGAESMKNSSSRSTPLPSRPPAAHRAAQKCPVFWRHILQLCFIPDSAVTTRIRQSSHPALTPSRDFSAVTETTVPVRRTLANERRKKPFRFIKEK